MADGKNFRTGGEEEIGERLTVDELKKMMVVVIRKEGRPYAISVWVELISEKHVIFLAGDINTHFIAQRLPDGRLVDDTGKEIYVHRYLGEI